MLRGNRYYESGILDKSALALPMLAIMLGTLAGYANGFLQYQFLDWHITAHAGIGGAILVTALFYIFFANLALATQCRNRKFVQVIAGFGGVVALYSAWAGFTHSLPAGYRENDRGLVEWFLSPKEIWDTAGVVAQYGWYSQTRYGWVDSPVGIWLYLHWIVEAGILVAGCSWAAVKGWEGRVFCERCKEWCEEDPASVRFDMSQVTDSKEERKIFNTLEHGGLDVLCKLPRTEDTSAASQVLLGVHTCTECHKPIAYRIQIISDDPHDAKKWHTDTSPDFMLDDNCVQLLEELKKQPKPAA